MSAGAIAEEAWTAMRDGRAISPFSQRAGGLDLGDSYAVTAAMRALRRKQGETPVGRKIGFTNHTIWPQYNVSGPIWGDMYDTTVHSLANGGGTYGLAAWPEPQIEPEIVVKLAKSPSPGMDERALLGCVAWVALGFEIVQSPFPGWRFAAADCVAAGGLHGALLIGEPTEIATADHATWVDGLQRFEIDLMRDGSVIDHGVGANVLGSPLAALGRLVEMLSGDRYNAPLAAGEIVTTGTVTRAFPIARGQRWSVEIAGLPLQPVAVAFS